MLHDGEGGGGHEGKEERKVREIGRGKGRKGNEKKTENGGVRKSRGKGKRKHRLAVLEE